MKLAITLTLLLLSSMAMAQASPGFVKVANVTITSYTDSSCLDLSTCGYQITAVNSSGLESPAFDCAATQLCMGGNVAIAIMPSSGTHTVAVGWQPSPTAGVTYNVYRNSVLGGGGLTTTVN